MGWDSFLLPTSKSSLSMLLPLFTNPPHAPALPSPSCLPGLGEGFGAGAEGGGGLRGGSRSDFMGNSKVGGGPLLP